MKINKFKIRPLFTYFSLRQIHKILIRIKPLFKIILLFLFNKNISIMKIRPEVIEGFDFYWKFF